MDGELFSVFGENFTPAQSEERLTQTFRGHYPSTTHYELREVHSTASENQGSQGRLAVLVPDKMWISVSSIFLC